MPFGLIFCSHNLYICDFFANFALIITHHFMYNTRLRMLQQFSVENFLSFKDKQVFNLMPSRGSRMKDHRAEPVKGHMILKTAAVFGPNAGGKSNFIKALNLCKTLIMVGTPSDSLIEYLPFQLDRVSKQNNTTFSFHILCNEKKYEYGFSYNQERISREWLKIISKKSDIIVFDRNNTSEFDLSYLMKLNPRDEEKQFLSFFAKATPPKQLFLHEILSRNIVDNVSNIEDPLAIIYWFIDNLKVLFPDTPYKQGGILKAISDEELKSALESLLKYFDTGIEGVDLTDVEYEKLDISTELRKIIRTDLSKSGEKDTFGALRLDDNLYLITYSDNDLKAKKLQTLHKKLDEEGNAFFSFSDESDGTKRIFDYIPLILDIIQGGKVLVIDEMERSLHPVLMKKLLNLFYKISSKSSTQLFFTTHESTLLTQDLLRRDEIWLMDKSKEGISSFKRLDDKFNIRFDKELEKDYLKGLFGAIPIFEANESIIETIRKFRNNKSRE